MTQLLTYALKVDLIVGVAAGLISFLLMLVEYFVCGNDGAFAGYIEGNGALLVLILAIVVGLRKRKRAALNSPMTLRQALSAGMVIALCTGLVYSLLSYSYISFVNSHYVDEMLLRQTYSVPHNATAAESAFERLIAEMKFRPMFQLVGKFLGSLFFGLIVSTVCVLVISKNRKVGSTRQTK